MGCQASNDTFDEALDDQLQQQMNVITTNKKGEQVDRFDQSHQPQQGFEGFFQAEEESVQQFMALKPWVGALVPPSQKPENNPSEPGKKLKLTFVNGFKVQDSRQNIFWKNKEEITYCAAALGIVMNVNSLKQRYLGGGNVKQNKAHNDDVISLGVSPDRKRVVTGSLGATPLILVWSNDNMEIIARTNLGKNTRAVSTIRFSRDGKLFFCSDKANDCTVYCYDASSAQLLGSNKCGSDPVFDGESGNNNTFAVATKRGMWFLDYDGSGLNKKKGIFGSNAMAAMITVAYSPQSNCFFSGTATGEVYVWEGNNCTKSFKMHEGAVMGLTWADKKLLSSGSKDNLLKVSSGSFETLATHKIPSYAKSLDLFQGQIIVGTKCGRIIKITESTNAQKEIMHGHNQGETWGLALTPEGNVLTTADDNAILSFNPKTFKVESEGIISNVSGKRKKIGGASTLSTLPPNQHSRAIAVNKAGHVMIGCNDGSVSVRTTKDLNKQVFGEKLSSEWIQVIKYSPDEKRVAVGSHDNNIYIYNVEGNEYKRSLTLKAHQSFITSLDWSRDSRYIQSNCGAYELLFFNAETGEQIQSGGTQLKDEKWATYSVKIGWWVQGIFPKYTSGDHVNGVDRNKGEDTIATGDDWGLVNLYRNPALKGAKCCSFKAHSSHVVRVNFDKQDQYVYSVGGYDKTLMMWKYE